MLFKNFTLLKPANENCYFGLSKGLVPKFCGTQSLQTGLFKMKPFCDRSLKQLFSFEQRTSRAKKKKGTSAPLLTFVYHINSFILVCNKFFSLSCHGNPARDFDCNRRGLRQLFRKESSTTMREPYTFARNCTDEPDLSFETKN